MWLMSWGVVLPALWRWSFSDAAAYDAPPKVVIIVTCSAHYTDFFENWYAWLGRLDIVKTAGLIAIAEDTVAYDYLTRRLIGERFYRRVVRATQGGTDPPLGGRLGFSSEGFATLMSRRAEHLEAQLRNLVSTTNWATMRDARLIFSDLDVIWIRNPIPWFAGDSCDAWAQTQHRERGLLNPGFLALAPTPRALSLLQEWARRLRERPQLNLPAFNEVVQGNAQSIGVCPLQPDIFLSAKRSFRRRLWSPFTDSKAVIAHANWIDGHDSKRAAFELVGAWLASPNVSAISAPEEASR